MASRRLGKLALENSSLFLCDMQEKFRPTIQYYPQIIATAKRLLDTSNVLDMPVIVTEQYPKGLGPTVSELDVSQLKVFPKTRFSMLVPDVKEHLSKLKDIKSVILCGIEAHVCVTQTVLDLIEEDYDVHVLVDACSSRSMVDRMYAFQRMREVGAFLTTSESAILSLCQDAKHPKFREVQKIIWDSAPDSGLLHPTPQGETAL